MEIQSAKIKNQNDLEEIKKIFRDNNVELGLVQKTGADTYLFRSKIIDSEQKNKIIQVGKGKYDDLQEARFETVGPVIGAELTQKAILAVVFASAAIVLYIVYAFREVPKPYSPWKFGVTAVVALIHDVLVVMGIFSILGQLYGVEVDSLFVTALLTVIGFSVHDTIVVFDRVRENLRKTAGQISFSEVVNESLIQTLARSLNTSITVLLVLFALILFGGESIRWFVVALFIGIFSGTYSSIFNAAPLLVIWEEKSKNKLLSN